MDMTRHDGKYISYLRVSTAKQGESGPRPRSAARGGRDLAERRPLEAGRGVRRDRERQEPSQPAEARAGARGLPPLRRQADHLAPRPPEPRSGVPAEPARCRHRLRRGRHAECEPHDRRRHGAGRRTGARGDLVSAPRRRSLPRRRAASSSAIRVPRRRASTTARPRLRLARRAARPRGSGRQVRRADPAAARRRSRRAQRERGGAGAEPARRADRARRSVDGAIGPEPEGAGVLMSHRPFAVRGVHARGARPLAAHARATRGKQLAHNPVERS